jgi:DNA-binding CsgD family transcriptional regulator
VREFYKNSLLLIILLSLITLSGYTQIQGKLHIDSTKWSTIAYLSIIPNFNQLNTISYNNIIERVNVDPNGRFVFQTKYLSQENHLYRIHFSKKEDPPTSLIIGGKDHNHMFLFAEKNSKISLLSHPGKKLFNNLQIEGFQPNKGLKNISVLINVLDSVDYYGSSTKRELIQDAIFEKLRHYADTCSLPLVSLLAIYQSNFVTDFQMNPEYYHSYLRLWKSNQTEYFKTFRKQLGINSESNWNIIILTVGLVIITILIYISYKFYGRKRKNPISKLTIQERKVLVLLQEGKSNKEIAEINSVSVSTVKSHANSIYSKLKVKSRKEILDMEK